MTDHGTRSILHDPWYRWAAAMLLAYAVGFALHPPKILLIGDEERYVLQALTFAQGRVGLTHAQILHPPSDATVPSNYPPGTSLLQTPLVWLFGWQGGAILSVFCLFLATFFTIRLLRLARAPPGFAILLPLFPGTLFFGRIAMSDMPGAAVVALALCLLWDEREERRSRQLAAGATSAASLLLREPIAILLVPFVAAAVANRRWRVWPLLLGSVLILALRGWLSHRLFGDALYVRPSGYGFSLRALGTQLPIYAVILALMFPLGIVLPFYYRGPHRGRTLIAFGAYVILFLTYEYDAITENGPAKGLILTSRFLVPALPLLVLMASDVFPRWYGRFQAANQRMVRAVAHASAGVACAAAFAIHFVIGRMEAVPLSIERALFAHTRADIPVVTNHKATLKYFSPVYGDRRLILRDFTSVEQAEQFVRRSGSVHLAFLDRSDSEMFRDDARRNETFLLGLAHRCTLHPVYDAIHGPDARVRIVTASRCGAKTAGL